MNERVVSLSDRGRALEWLSLGFGLWLVAGLFFALLVADSPHRVDEDGVVSLARSLALASCAAHLIAGAAVAVGAVLLARAGSWLWPSFALAALAVVLVERTVLVWLPPILDVDRTWDLPLMWSIGSVAQLVLIASVLQGVRGVARGEGGALPIRLDVAIIGAEITRLALLSTLRLELDLVPRDPLQPWVRAGLVAVVSMVSASLLLLAIRETSAVVRTQIWAGEPGISSPARAGDWQRTARGLDRFGAFLIAKIALDAASIPIFIVAGLTGIDSFFAVQLYVVPLASAVFSAGMVIGLVACRQVPDPPDARAGFTGAALLVAACVAGLVYLTWAGAWQPMAEALLALGHLVAYLAVLRSIGRIGERLGDDPLTRRARTLGGLAALAVGSSAVGGFLLRRSVADLAVEIAVPIAVAGAAFAVLLPCALLGRELARTLRRRFAEPPRAVARVS